MSFARLAARISSWTTRAVLAAIVAVAAIGFGRQTLEWWADSEPSSADAPRPSDALASSPPHELQFGDRAWSALQESARGSRTAALAALRRWASEATRQAALPADSPGAAEERFVALLSEKKPQEAGEGWEVHEIEGPTGVTVGLRRGETGDRGGAIAAAAFRVVTWGMVVPAGRDAWTLYLFRAGKAGADAGLPDLPLPPGARRTLAVRAADGGGLIGFAGAAAPETWKADFDAAMAERGWQGQGWRRLGTTWHGRWMADGRPAVQIQFADDAQDAVGLILVTPNDK